MSPSPEQAQQQAQEVVEFWFGHDAADRSDSEIAGRQSGLWWGKDAATDRTIRDRFGDLVPSAGRGALDDWKATDQGWLALILLTDQFTRNVYRDTPAMFGFDDVALALCKDGLDAGIDDRLRPIQCVFFYLPLEHSEDRADQARCVALMRALAQSVAAEERAVFSGFVDYALAHQRIVDRFGRFPHRNEILGRESSAEEIEFLRQPGSSF
jgi:uncharacterized protein (DUF924 family)